MTGDSGKKNKPAWVKQPNMSDLPAPEDVREELALRHQLMYLGGGRMFTLLGLRWYEHWMCHGCGISYEVKGRDLNNTVEFTTMIKSMHSGFLTWVAIFYQARDFRVEAKQKHIKLKIDLTLSRYGSKYRMLKGTQATGPERARRKDDK